MVCARCIMVVKAELEKAGLHPLHVELGQAELPVAPTAAQLSGLTQSLENLGFELMDDRRSRTIEQIKKVIIQLVHHNEEHPQLNLSAHIALALHYEYNYLSTLFSDVEGLTIEKYFILQKIERAKELLVYDELSVSQIADKLGYSSVAHLSNQFKQVTGFTPSHFKTIREQKRKPLDKV